MRTVGEILKKARMEKRLALEDIEKNLRIRKKFLEALEENEWNKLPSLPYIKGFLRNYSTFLGLAPEEMVAIFRRQFRDQEKAGLLPEGITHPLNEPILRFTPQIAVIGVIIVFVFFFFGYLFFQYRTYTSPPNLTISVPAEGETIKTDKVQVRGKTDVDAVVSVNNIQIAINETGEFSTTLTLPPGVNAIIIEATSKFGKKNTITRTIQMQQ